MKRFNHDASRARMLILRTKRPTVSEAINAEMENRTRRLDADHHDGYEDDTVSGAVEDYDLMDSTTHVSAVSRAERDAPSSRRAGHDRHGHSGSGNGGLNTPAPLRRRGPLDGTLSSGRYATTAQAVRRVHDTMDDIFGALDMGDMDAEGQEEYITDSDAESGEEEGRRRGGGKEVSGRRRRAKELSEEEYVAWLERKRRRARAAQRGGSATDEEEDEAEMTEYPVHRVEQRRSRHASRDTRGAADEKEEEEEGESGRTVGATRAKRARESAAAATTKKRQRREQTEDEIEEEKEEHHADDETETAGYKATRTALTLEEQEESDIVQQLRELRQRLTEENPVAAAPRSVTWTGEEEKGTTGGEGEADTRDTVRHFHLLHSHLLRLRVKLQPVVVKALSLPQYYAMPYFVRTSAEVRQRREAVTEALTQTLHDLMGCVESSGICVSMHKKEEEHDSDAENGTVGRSSHSTAAETTRKHSVKKSRGTDAANRGDFDALTRFHTAVLQSAQVCLGHWGSRAVQANGVKLKAISQPLPQQIESILLSARSRLRAKVQRNRSHLRILAHPEHLAVAESGVAAAAAAAEHDNSVSHAAHKTEEETSGNAARAERMAEARARRAAHIADGDVDEEIFDDSDFLRELVHRGGTAATRLERQLREMQTVLQLPSSKPSRVGMHRQTKGKTVSYDPIPKLVGFTVASGFENSSRKETIVRSLFQ